MHILLPFLNQRKGENGGRVFVSWPNLRERMYQAWGPNPRPSAFQVVRAFDRPSVPGLKDIWKQGINGDFLFWNVGIYNSGKFETLIALQNDLRWLLLHTWFSKFPRGRSPGPPYKKRYSGKFWISSFIQPLRHTATPALPYWSKKKKTLLSRHLPMSRTTSPAPFFSYITVM